MTAPCLGAIPLTLSLWRSTLHHAIYTESGIQVVFSFSKVDVTATTDQRTFPKVEPEPTGDREETPRLPIAPPQPSESPETEHSWWGLRRGDIVVGLVLVVVCLTLTAWHWARLSGWGLREIEIDRPVELVFEYRLDINSATWVEWMQLPGIGETLARRIVEDREEHGPFESVEDVQRVKGVGVKTLAKLQPWLTVNSHSVESSAFEFEPRE